MASPATSAGWAQRGRAHWPIVAVLALASVLLFTGLGRDYLWADEGDTAVLAKSILTSGVPTAWDGATFIDSDFGTRVNDNLVMVGSPWLQYYVTASSFAVFGATALAARLPFALFGLATIALVYVILLRVSHNRWAAMSASILLTVSVQFLLYARQSRHYSLNAALTCLLVLQFMRLDSWTASAVFAAIGILLFHSHPIALAPMFALGLLTLVYAPFRGQRRWFWRAMPIVAVFTLPWLVIARSGYALNVGLLQGSGTFFPRLGQYVIECASVTSVIGALVLFVAVVRRRRGEKGTGPARKAAQLARAGVLAPDERALVVALVAIMATYAVVMALTQPRDTIWSIGLRYTPAVIPFMAMIAALLIARASRGHWRPWLALLLVFGFTKIGQLMPWTFWEEPRAKRDPSAAVTFHNPRHPVDRVFGTEQIGFIQALFQASPGTTGRIVEYLNAHAARQDIVVTNYGWEPLSFHTGLRQGMTVLPSYPIYGAAKAHGLPDYVFRAEGARWIVWRKAWGAYRGQALDKVLDQLRADRVPITLVATIPETLWENRENVLFRRFPGDRYIYPWYGEVPATEIYRVDWPGANGGAGGGSTGPG